MSPLWVLTDRARCRGRNLIEVVAACAAGGATTVVLREKDLAAPERRRLADELLAHADGLDEVVVATDDPTGDAASFAGAGIAGFHASVTATHAASALSPNSVHLCAPYPGFCTKFRWGASVHDHKELSTAAAAGAAWVTVSPVQATASKPGHGPALGTDGLADLATASPVPAIALGGIDRPSRVAGARHAGAAGVAVMGALMAARDPAATTAELLAAWAEAGVAP